MTQEKKTNVKTYRLKDADKQAHLEAVFPMFNERLQEACRKQMGDATKCVVVSFENSVSVGASMGIYKESIEQVIEYDPNGWNEWPAVTPPYDVPMRIEIHEACICEWTCAVYMRANPFYETDHWAYVFDGRDDAPIDTQFDKGVTILFRPWND